MSVSGPSNTLNVGSIAAPTLVSGLASTVNGDVSTSIQAAGLTRVSVSNAGNVGVIPNGSTTRGTWTDTGLSLLYSTQGFIIRSLVGLATTSAFYGLGAGTPSASNHSLLINDAGDSATLNGSANVRFAVGNVAKVFATTTQVTIVPVSTTRITVTDTLTRFSYSNNGMTVQALTTATQYTAFYGGSVTPSGTNYAIAVLDDGTDVVHNASTTVRTAISGAVKLTVSATTIAVAPSGTARATFSDATLNLTYSTQGLKIQAQVGAATTTAFYAGGVVASSSNYAFFASDDGSQAGINGSSSVALRVAGSARVFASTTSVAVTPNGVTTRLAVVDTLATVTAIPMAFTAASSIYTLAGIQGYKDTTDAYDTMVGTAGSSGHSVTLAPAGLSGIKTTVKLWRTSVLCSAKVFTIDIPIAALNGIATSTWNATKGNMTLGVYVWANAGTNYTFQLSRAIIIAWAAGPGSPSVLNVASNTTTVRSDELQPNTTDVTNVSASVVGSGASAVVRLVGTLKTEYSDNQRVVAEATIYANEFS
jgi:hypothetical protein